MPRSIDRFLAGRRGQGPVRALAGSCGSTIGPDARSTTIKSLRDQIEPEFTVYRESVAELDLLRTQADERARLGRMARILWRRSHRNLAAGIPVPPVIDVVGIMKGTVSTGVKGVLPLP